MYLGLSSFLLSRIVFELTCPKAIRKHDDTDGFIVDLLEKIKLAKETGDEQSHDFFKNRLSRFNGLHRKYRNRNQGLRLGLSIGFLFSIILLVTPPLGKFVRILFDYINPFIS